MKETTTNQIPRPEHPKPQFQREDWINLNGHWTYEFDPGKSGMKDNHTSMMNLVASSGYRSLVDRTLITLGDTVKT